MIGFYSINQFFAERMNRYRNLLNNYSQHHLPMAAHPWVTFAANCLCIDFSLEEI